MSRIVVLGSATVDFMVRQARLAQAGETIFGQSLTMVPGGKGLNQAVAASRAGGDVAFLGAIGDDVFGEHVRAALLDAGVSVDRLRTVPGATGTAHIAVLDGGENAIAIVPAANSAVATFEDHDALGDAGYLVSQFERPIALILEAFTAARERGITTVLTPAPVVDAPAELLDLTDILVPNAIEARQLAGLDDERDAAVALSRRAGLVVMTLGERGSIAVREGEIVHELPARRVAAVDTTAAGDSFVGALVAWLAEGSTLEGALRSATAAASVCVTRLGTSSALPSRQEIDAALA